MKKLLFGLKSATGRNKGRISSYHRGGGNKKLYRFVDYCRNLFEVPGKVIAIEHDPRRSARVALIAYTNGILSYITSTAGLRVGDYVFSSLVHEDQEKTTLSAIATPLKLVNFGVKINSVEIIPTKGAQLARAAGTFVTFIRSYGSLGLIKLPSGQYRVLSLDCFCVIGTVMNAAKKRYFGKAGISRRHGWRPVVRGRAMNPVDHPHGGRTNGGMTPTTPWGLLAKGQKTTSSSAAKLKLSKI